MFGIFSLGSPSILQLLRSEILSTIVVVCLYFSLSLRMKIHKVKVRKTSL